MENRGRDLLVIIAGFVLSIGSLLVARYYSLWVLVPIPSLVAVVYQILSLSSRYDSRKSVVDAYRQFTQKFDSTWADTDTPMNVSEDLSDDMERHKPSLASMMWGAALLTAVFSIPAVISSGGRTLTATTDPRLDQVSAALKKAQKLAAVATPSIKDIKAALTAAEEDIVKAKNGLPEWQRGLVYSGFGVWVLIVMRTIGRINAGGLSARFLITASLRASAAMMLGFFAGATDVLANVSVAGDTTYFLIGMFYPLFFEQLRDEAFRRFKRNKPITTELPTNWVDGVDDDTQDILTEVNVLSVQHLATSDPGVLTMRSLFPFVRVLDLIDQAILVSYFRDNIVVLRSYGIRGVMDFVSAIEPVIRQSPNHEEAEKAIAEIAGKLKISVETLMTFSRSIYSDYRVNLLMRLWQHNVQPEGYRIRRAVNLVPKDDARIPIKAEGEASYRAFSTIVSQLIEEQLRREAAERAARFREEHPDDTRPDDTTLQTSFSEAWAAAKQRATIGASPSPSARARQLYEEEFLGALS